ncbi:1919_t:CDS:2, partial [Scutellospora calospora]
WKNKFKIKKIMTESMVEENQGICEQCKQPNISHKWCKDCNSKHFQKQFSNWTSNNIIIDKFIQDIQLKAINKYQVIEWIPYENFLNVEYLARGGYGEVFKAKWKDGCIQCWDHKNQKWDRTINKLDGLDVVLKSLYDSKDIASEFLEEINYQITSYDDYLLNNKQKYSELWNQIVTIEQSKNEQSSNTQINDTSSIRLNYTTHPQAVYTSHLINVSQFSLKVSDSIK